MTAHRFHSLHPLPLAAALCLALAGCAGPVPPISELPTPTAPAAPRAIAAEQLADASEVNLRQRVQIALRERRMFAPAGDNAIEHYVALRDRSATPDADAQGALMELQPYAVIGAEQALSRGDFAEAQRLSELIAAIDPAAPSLGRIAGAIAAKAGAPARVPLELMAAVESDAETAPVTTPDAPRPLAFTQPPG